MIDIQYTRKSSSVAFINIINKMITCPKSISFWSLSDVLPSMETCLVTESLEVLHDLTHVLDRHDDQCGGAQEEEAAG